MVGILGLTMIEVLSVVIVTILTACLGYLRKIAQYSKENHRYLHGDEQNPHHDGVLDIVKQLLERVEELTERVEELMDRVARLERDVFGDNDDSGKSD